jgi:FixJ family two-component response regulator
LEGYDAKQPGCFVLDFRLPGMTGIALVETLRSRRIDAPAIILTAHGTTAALVDALRLKVLDFLEKPVDARILLARIHLALQEDSIRCRERARAEVIRSRMARLSAREMELVERLVAGKTNKEIARELSISVKTVSHHRAHIMHKTTATSLAELIHMSITVLNQ